MTLEFHSFKNIRHIETTSPDFTTIPWSKNIEPKGTWNYVCLKKLENVNKKTEN